MEVIDAEVGPALGSAIFAAVAAGCHENIEAATQAMKSRTVKVYTPLKENVEVYEELYQEYMTRCTGSSAERGRRCSISVPSEAKSANNGKKQQGRRNQILRPCRLFRFAPARFKTGSGSCGAVVETQRF